MQPFIKSTGGVESSQEDSVRVDIELCEPREKFEYRKARTAAEGIKDLIDAGDRNLGGFSDLIQFLVINGDSNAAGFLRNAYEGAGP